MFSFYGPLMPSGAGFGAAEEKKKPWYSKLPSFGFEDIPVEARRAALGEAMFSMGTRLLSGAVDEGYGALGPGLAAGMEAYKGSLGTRYALAREEAEEKRRAAVDKSRIEANEALAGQRTAKAEEVGNEKQRQIGALELVQDPEDRTRLEAQIGSKGFWTAYNKTFEDKGEKAPTTRSFGDEVREWDPATKSWKTIWTKPEEPDEEKDQKFGGLTPAQVEQWIERNAKAEYDEAMDGYERQRQAAEDPETVPLPPLSHFVNKWRALARGRFGYSPGAPKAGTVTPAGGAVREAPPTAEERPTTPAGGPRTPKPPPQADQQLLEAAREDVLAGRETPQSAFEKIASVYGEEEAVRLFNLAIQMGWLVKAEG